jgi:L-threonylcarbamoyladenylate synthase
MQRHPVSPTDPDADVIADAAARLRVGELVAFPTETVYGLGANAFDAEAVGKIFAAKGRPATNPVIVHVADAAGARDVVAVWPESARKLAMAFWPGPLTLVLPKSDKVPDIATAGLPYVGVRVPAHPVALALLRAARIPVAAPSANKSNELSPTSAWHVIRSLDSVNAIVLDGGPTSVGIESTVVDLSGDTPVILRPGGVSAAQVSEVLGVPVSIASSANDADDAVARKSPGTLQRHYAPRAPLRLVPAGDPIALATSIDAARTRGKRIGVVVWRHPELPFPWDVLLRELPDDPDGYASVLYATLHELDAEGVGEILVERVPETAAWAAVGDRLRRAAT